MRGKPRKGVLRHSNQQISELFKSSEILSSLSKRLFRQADATATWPPRLLFPRLFVESGVHIVDILLIQFVLRQPQALAEALEVDDLPGPQEPDGVVDVWIVRHAQDVVIRKAGFLLCCNHVKSTFSDSGKSFPLIQFCHIILKKFNILYIL